MTEEKHVRALLEISEEAKAAWKEGDFQKAARCAAEARTNVEASDPSSSINQLDGGGLELVTQLPDGKEVRSTVVEALKEGA